MLRGLVAAKDEKSIVLLVAGVGYQLFLSAPSLEHVRDDTEMTLWTYLAVRDDALQLFGFVHRDELAFFELLLSVPGIGPKGALGITGLAPLPTLVKAISAGDVGYLTKVSGIGRKTAEKIVLELKGKLALLSHEESAATPLQSADADVLAALLSLGYGEREAREVVQGLPKEVGSIEERVTLALKQVRR